jgi:hypothetical protein
VQDERKREREREKEYWSIPKEGGSAKHRPDIVLRRVQKKEKKQMAFEPQSG